MLDINAFRVEKGGDPEKIRESQRKRYACVEDVDKVIELDEQWRQANYLENTKKKELNALNKAIGAKMKNKEDATEEKKQQVGLKAEIADIEAKCTKLEQERDAVLVTIGNFVDPSVPVSDDEENNAVVRTFEPEPRTVASDDPAAPAMTHLSHVDLVQMLDIVDLESGSAVAGARGYYLKRHGLLLNQALINYALEFLVRRRSEPVMTPFFMRREVMAECAQLSQFDEELYKVSGEGDDKYLIATSEQPLCSLFRKKTKYRQDLPQRIAGYSTCFRKEAGSHGRDTLGIFRIHQFEKVEQFCLSAPEDSVEMHEEMLKNSEDFYKSLQIPYRVVNIVSGELNNAAAKKYDLEAWFPASKTFRELVSCSNCTDYQSRRLGARLFSPRGPADEGPKEFVHMLNSTLTATERTICCLLENWQTPEGIEVPPVLRKYMMGIEFIPFVKKMVKKGKNITYEPIPDADRDIKPGDLAFGASEDGLMYT